MLGNQSFEYHGSAFGLGDLGLDAEHFGLSSADAGPRCIDDVDLGHALLHGAGDGADGGLTTDLLVPGRVGGILDGELLGLNSSLESYFSLIKGVLR